DIIVAGGGMIGCETAMYLAEKEKKKVTIIEKLTDIGRDIDPIFNKIGLMKRLTEDGITILTGYEVEEVLEGSTRISYDGKKE
ncbi:FAD-dependent oxidoreductase, partial [bacterium]|nr:FAD-dependent oxidoreductase [bacterium]